MAIIIPSKNIYEINNPKTRDNVIDKVSVEETIVKPNNEYEVNVYNQEPFNIVTNDTIIDPNNKDRQTKLITKSVSIQGGNFLWAFFCSHTEYNSYKKSQTITIKIPKVKNNSYISKIYYGLNEDGENNIKYSLFGSKQSGTVTANLSFDITSSGGTNPKITNIVYSNPTIDFEDEHYEIPKKETFVYEGFAGGEIGGTNGIATSEATLYDSSSLLTSIPYNYIENGIEYYCIDIDFIVGVRIVKMGGAVLEHSETNMSGTYEEYIPKQIEITIYGNTIGIDITDGSVSYVKDENGNIVQGKGNKPHSLSGNELLQDSAKVGDIALTKHLAKNVLEQYKKGKETATLLCSIGEYYDTLYPKRIENLSYNGKNFIQTNKLTIKNTITNPHEQGYSAKFNFALENIEMVGNETSIIIETPIDPDIAKSVLYFNLPDYVTLESNPVVVTKSKTLITIKTQNKQQMIDFAREHYGTLVTDYCYKVEQYRYTEAPISVYKLNVLDSSFNIITELYNEIFFEPKDFTFSFDKTENYKYLELVFTTTVSEDKCIIVYDVGILPNGKHDLEVKVFNTTNGNFEVFIKEIKYVAISTKDLSLPMVFRLHDEVIPMVYSANGVDVPMSRYQYGLPKVFEVTGSNIIYDGAVWQELTLQEI